MNFDLCSEVQKMVIVRGVLPIMDSLHAMRGTVGPLWLRGLPPPARQADAACLTSGQRKPEFQAARQIFTLIRPIPLVAISA